MITINIPGEMRGKGRPRFARRGPHVHAFTDAATANAETWVRACAVSQANGVRFSGAVSMIVDIHAAIPASWPKKRREDALAGRILPTTKPDLDNCIKLIGDALNGILWDDDKQVVRVVAAKRYAENAETILTVMAV